MSDYKGFPSDTVPFLNDLTANNDTDWFADNRDRYEPAYLQAAKDFVAAMEGPLTKLSPSVHAEPAVNKSIFRVNRDTRFSKDKTPYKNHIDLMFWDGEGRSRDCAAFFFRLTPTEMWLGAGKHGFSKEEMELFREAVAGDAGAELEKIITSLEADGFEVDGDQYKRVPTGYDADHPRAELLKYKGLASMYGGGHPAELNSPAIVDFCAEKFAATLPLLVWVRDNVVEPAK